MMFTNRNWHIKWSRNALRCCVALAVALLIVVADYLASNLSFPLLDASESLSLFGYLAQDKEDDSLSDAVCVNVAVDKQLIPIVDEFGDTIGNVPATDREKLLDFLKVTAQSNYKYVFLDIRFEKGLTTAVDSALFSTIISMPRLVFSTHRADGEYEMADSAMYIKSALADYRNNMFSGFTRYEFIQDGEESVALRIYRDLTGKTICRCGPIYLSDGALCYNMQFVPMPSNLVFPYGEHGEIRYPYLGAQLMDMHSDAELKEMMDDKIVVIGDFDNDLHQSYIGDVPGPLISYYAYRLLSLGGHKVNYWYIALLMLIYTVIAYSLMRSETLTATVMQKLGVESPWVLFLLSFLGWEFVLTILKILFYIIFNISFIATLPTAAFSLISLLKSIGEVRRSAKILNNTAL